MNEDASTFEVPEYIFSRLQPGIQMDYPTREEEYRILRTKLGSPSDELLNNVVDLLQRSHSRDDELSVRDGLNIARYAHRLTKFNPEMSQAQALAQSVSQIVGEASVAFNGPSVV